MQEIIDDLRKILKKLESYNDSTKKLMSIKADKIDRKPKDKKIKPSICTSLRCRRSNNIYCPKCSHAIYQGEGQDEFGKLWMWDYRPRFGVYFVRRPDRKLLKRQPSEGNSALLLFEKWKKKKGL